MGVAEETPSSTANQPLSRLEGYRVLYVPLSKGSSLTRQLMVKRNDQAADPAEWPNESKLKRGPVADLAV